MQEQKQHKWREYLNLTEGLVEREIFSDPAIYRREMELIFARGWNFMCHESQIPNSGDYFVNYIGEESVIASRDKEGHVRVFLNSCRHRGNAVCRAESGNARSFLCSYHGWNYGLDGQLLGVPGYSDLYGSSLDKKQWGLVPAAKVSSYRGFVFATMDAGAPDLEDFLGEVGRAGLSFVAGQGNMVVAEGVQKNRIACNWKIAVDNVFDWYHLEISHASAFQTGMIPRKTGDDAHDQTINPLTVKEHRVLLGDYGHAISGPRANSHLWASARRMASGEEPVMPLSHAENLMWRLQPEGADAVGDYGLDAIGHPNIFPNLFITVSGAQIGLRLPKGPNETEIWWFTFVDQDAPPELQQAAMSRAAAGFGPAGLLEQDDGENWEASTNATKGPIGRRFPLNYQMDPRETRLTITEGRPALIDTNINEFAQLWVYQNWAEWMEAQSWDDLKQRKPRPEDVVQWIGANSGGDANA